MHCIDGLHIGRILYFLEDFSMLNRQQLRTFRRKRCLTQQALAVAIGVYQPDISHLERGVHTDVSTARLAALAAALRVRMEQLIVAEKDLQP
jgi:transcriptional regulator with XRE-family HTH domain